jgi:hypothetical protein
MRIHSTRRYGAKPGDFSASTLGDEWSSRRAPPVTTVDGGHMISFRGIEMQLRRRLRHTLARYWGRLRGFFTPTVAEDEPEDTGYRSADRGRFWRELREGQREADAHAARSHP